MKNCIKLLFFLLKYLAFWIAFFFFFRAFFLIYNYNFTADLSMMERLQTFRHGFAMDLAMATYFCFFPVLVCLFSPVIRSNISYSIIFVYSIIVLIITSILGLFDIGLYADWGLRLSPQILPALENPKGMLACVTTGQLVVLFLLEIGIVSGFVFLYTVLFKSVKKQNKQKWWSILLFLSYGALLIIPMRGGLQTTPINMSSAYFSSKLYANHAAINPYWSFFNRLIYPETDVQNLTFVEQDLCNTIIHNAMQEQQADIPVFIKSKNNQPVNVILIIVESLSSKVIEPLGGAPDITPNFNKLATEGILFSNFYATGNRSDKGIAGLLAAYPAMVGPYSVLHFPEKIGNLDYLAPYFAKNNYKTHFYYAGEIDFYNTKTLVLQSKYDKIISIHDFPLSERQQKWGIPDALFYTKLLEDSHTFSTPFFLVTYNISSHPPYDIPEIENRSYKDAISYSDQWLGNFVAQLKKSPFWENSLVVITADHGTMQFTGSSISNPLTYKIPMLWIGGVVDTAFVNENIGMQTDLTATLVHQLGWKHKANPFSVNLFGNTSRALFFNTNGYGFVSKDLAYYYNTEVNTIDFYYDTNEQTRDSVLQFSKAFVQFLQADFKGR